MSGFSLPPWAARGACKECGTCRNANNAEAMNCPGVVKVGLRDQANIVAAERLAELEAPPHE